MEETGSEPVRVEGSGVDSHLSARTVSHPHSACVCLMIVVGTLTTEVCTVELIGEIEVSGNSATFLFRGVGSGITGYICKLNGIVLPNCTSAIDSYVPQIGK